jgi:GntR family transcriptional regulator
MYQQIAEDIRAQIRAKILKRGDKLPSTRELCAQYDVSHTVVRSTMILLKAEGLVDGQQGRGVFVL